MMTKEEYKESLNELFVYSKHIANKVEIQSLSECYERLEQLINEHFELLEKYQNLQDENARLSFDKIVNNIEDMNYKLWLENPPLKFEELKEGMWVFDNIITKRYMKIYDISYSDKSFNVNGEWCGDDLFLESFAFQENRFFRKQVE